MNPIVEDVLGGISLILLGVYLGLWFRTVRSAANSDLEPSTKGFWVLAILVFQLFGMIAWWLGPGQPQARG